TYESFKLTSFAITPPPPATITSVTADKSAPQPPGTTVTFTATATGGKPPYQFKWWVYDEIGRASCRERSESPTFAWTPSAANAAAQLSTWVRSSANLTDTYDSFKLTSFAITPPPPATITSVTADKSAPQSPGTTVTFTATATGGKPPYQFKWWVFD